MFKTLTTQVEGTACADQEPFALMVLGEEMQPEFMHGAVITIDPGHPLVNGAFVIAELAGELLFRQYVIEDTRAYLSALQGGDKRVLPSVLPQAWALKGVVTQSYKKRVTTHYHYGENGGYTSHQKVRGKTPKGVPSA